MENKCSKYWRVGMACPPKQPAPELEERFASVPPSTDCAGSRGIAFDAGAIPASRIPIPGYNAPALPLKPARDPSLSLIALSGLEPSGPVMVQVPLVHNNSAFSAAPTLSGRRVGFAQRWGHDQAAIEHGAAFLHALDVLRRAGTNVVAVPARRADDPHPGGNEIDELVHAYQLDALVADSQNAAFHDACWSGYPRLNEPLEDGAVLWFYGARWSKDSLAALVLGYRNFQRLV
ncbi:hypothetical protein YA0871_20825 [Pseudomonas paralactis]|uniref:Amidase n=2 Tax=Pseudomonas paralactis TaxID=1615673 RepID=A0ABS0V486_9PSED|nr:hypothetical protein [Pseudomonas paralactis]